MVKVYTATDVGRVREVNEDSFTVIAPETYVVADGMGGHASGEVASRILVDTAKELLDRPEVFYSELVLKKAVLRANDAILSQASEVPEYAGMGTTATLFHREGEQGIWAHVGDSRIYLLRGQELCQITRDHSLVEDLVENGSITREEARNHPRKNILTRAVGAEENLLVDTGSLRLQNGDRLLLCSDGLTNMVTDAQIQEILQDGHPMDKAAVLVQKALEAGGTDNITAIVVEYDAQ